jgi:hypothetical protein
MSGLFIDDRHSSLLVMSRRRSLKQTKVDRRQDRYHNAQIARGLGCDVFAANQPFASTNPEVTLVRILLFLGGSTR